MVGSPSTWACGLLHSVLETAVTDPLGRAVTADNMHPEMQSLRNNHLLLFLPVRM